MRSIHRCGSGSLATSSKLARRALLILSRNVFEPCCTTTASRVCVFSSEPSCFSAVPCEVSQASTIRNGYKWIVVPKALLHVASASIGSGADRSRARGAAERRQAEIALVGREGMAGCPIVPCYRWRRGRWHAKCRARGGDLEHARKAHVEFVPARACVTRWGVGRSPPIYRRSDRRRRQAGGEAIGAKSGRAVSEPPSAARVVPIEWRRCPLAPGWA